MRTAYALLLGSGDEIIFSGVAFAAGGMFAPVPGDRNLGKLSAAAGGSALILAARGGTFMRTTAAGLMLAATAVAAFAWTNRIEPANERALDQRIAYFRQLAADASCDPKDRTCALGQRALLQSAVDLASIYPKCKTQPDPKTCDAAKAIRLAAATARRDAFKAATIAGRGPVTIFDLYGEDPKPGQAALEAYADAAQRDYDASTCTLDNQVCVMGRLALAVEIDQAVRHQFDYCKSPDDLKAQEVCSQPILARMKAIDRLATDLLLSVTARYGWPDALHWGHETQQNAWLLAQHADANPKAQKRFFALLKAAFEQGTVPPWNYAYLVDRRATHEDKPQVYGTQMRCVGEGTTRTAEPLTLEDPARVDERRSEMGMGPLKDYQDDMRKICRGED
jgi:hypothetical protein